MADLNRPSRRRTPRGEFDRVDAEQEALRRDRHRTNMPTPLVKLDEQESESWPPGTAWLDLSVIASES